jgi:hypothetical protein
MGVAATIRHPALRRRVGSEVVPGVRTQPQERQ